MAAEFSNLDKLIETIVRDKGIQKQIVIDAIVQGMLLAARKKYGTYREIEASYNEDSGEIELHEFKEAVDPENFVDEEVEIKLAEAKELDPECKIGDYIGIKMDSSDLGRVAVQTAKQIIMQKVRDAEHEIIFQEFEKRRGEIASGIVRRVEYRTIVVDLGRTEAYLPQSEQIPGEIYKPGDRVQGYILDVKQTTRGPQIIMSRIDEKYMIKLFEIEVPEVHDGIVKIVAAAREPGSRAKIAVISKDNAVDPVGACVGMKGSRVQNVVQELQGEKIDIVPFKEDIISFVCNAIQPSEVARVFINEENKEMEVVVPDAQLSLAIGKKGQNVRLATKLTGWQMKIVSESDVAKRQAEAIFNLSLLENISDTMAQNIYQSNFSSIKTLAEATVEEVMTIPGYESKEKALKLIDESKAFIQKYKDEGQQIPSLATKTQDTNETAAPQKPQKDKDEDQQTPSLATKTQDTNETAAPQKPQKDEDQQTPSLATKTQDTNETAAPQKPQKDEDQQTPSLATKTQDTDETAASQKPQKDEDQQTLSLATKTQDTNETAAPQKPQKDEDQQTPSLATKTQDTNETAASQKPQVEDKKQKTKDIKTNTDIQTKPSQETSGPTKAENKKMSASDNSETKKIAIEKKTTKDLNKTKTPTISHPSSDNSIDSAVDVEKKSKKASRKQAASNKNKQSTQS